MIGLIFCCIYIRKGLLPERLVESIIEAVSVWGTLLLVITELFSIGNSINRVSLLLFWGIVVGIDCFVIYRSYRKRNFSGIELVDSCRTANWKNTVFVFWCFFATIMILAAIKVVPYNYDSMTYHLSRIFHWARNESVAHYATHIDRQICSPVFGEFVLLHSYVITGGDRFVNLLQCVSFLFNGVLVYEIAKKLGVNKQWSCLGMLLFYSAPICFSEALTTQVDHFGAMWALMFIYYILDYLIPSKEYKMKFDFRKMLLMGIMVGLGYLTKPNVCIPMFIFVIGLLAVCIYRRDNIIIMLKMALTAMTSFLIIVVPEMIRNIVTFGSISSPEAGAKQLIGTVEPRYVLINFIKNIFFNIPNKMLPDLGYYLYKIETKLAALLRVVNDSLLISEDGREYSVSEMTAYSCDKATSPIVFWTFAVCLLLAIIFAKRVVVKRLSNLYFILSGASFLLFCCILRWEPYVGRYMLVFWGVLIPGMMYILSAVFSVKNREIVCITVLSTLCLFSVISLFTYNSQFIMGNGRFEGYFSSWENSYASYEVWANYINDSDVHNVALITHDNVYEYPLDIMIGADRQIEHVDVTNDTAKYELEDFDFDCIVFINYKVSTPDLIESRGNEYQIVETTRTELGGVYRLCD